MSVHQILVYAIKMNTLPLNNRIHVTKEWMTVVFFFIFQKFLYYKQFWSLCNCNFFLKY